MNDNDIRVDGLSADDVARRIAAAPYKAGQLVFLRVDENNWDSPHGDYTYTLARIDRVHVDYDVDNTIIYHLYAVGHTHTDSATGDDLKPFTENFAGLSWDDLPLA